MRIGSGSVSAMLTVSMVCRRACGVVLQSAAVRWDVTSTKGPLAVAWTSLFVKMGGTLSTAVWCGCTAQFREQVSEGRSPVISAMLYLIMDAAFSD